MLKFAIDTLDNGWKTWLAQAAELQLLRADKDNSNKQGTWFFKMSEEAIETVQEDKKTSPATCMNLRSIIGSRLHA